MISLFQKLYWCVAGWLNRRLIPFAVLKERMEVAMMMVVTAAGIAALFPIYQYFREAKAREAERAAVAIAAIGECYAQRNEAIQRSIKHRDLADRIRKEKDASDVKDGLYQIMGSEVTEEYADEMYFLASQSSKGEMNTATYIAVACVKLAGEIVEVARGDPIFPAEIWHALDGATRSENLDTGQSRSTQP